MMLCMTRNIRLSYFGWCFKHAERCNCGGLGLKGSNRELLIGDLEFRTKLNATLAADLRLAGPQSRSSADQYEVVYGIVIKSQRPIELPLFSKVCRDTRGGG